MAVYFAVAFEIDAVKIGYTAGDPEDRIRQLQCGCSEELFLLYVIPEGTRGLERHYHEVFAKHRKRGEWFTYMDDIWRHVKRLKRSEDLEQKWQQERDPRYIDA